MEKLSAFGAEPERDHIQPHWTPQVSFLPSMGKIWGIAGEGEAVEPVKYFDVLLSKTSRAASVKFSSAFSRGSRPRFDFPSMAVQHNQVVGDTAETGPAPQSIDVEKDDVYHQEAKLEMLDPRGQAVDYSGATKKTDPAEIKLVRKLDLWIMVS